MAIFPCHEVTLGLNKDRHLMGIDHVIVLEHAHGQSKCLVLEIVHGSLDSMDMVKSRHLNEKLVASTIDRKSCIF